MPGVNVTTVTRTGPTAPNLAPAGQLFMAGLAERGSTTAPVRIRGLADFETYFGGRVAYSQLYENIQTFFEEGGSQAYVVPPNQDALGQLLKRFLFWNRKGVL